MQQLILPIKSTEITADYKNEMYRKSWGFHHYGWDLIDKNKSDRSVTALGNGMVIAAGLDGSNTSQRLGYCIVIVYCDVKLLDGSIKDIVCRMFHFASINCKAGDAINKNIVIGQYGSTGAYSSGPHLHIEFDTDTKYPQYAFGISGSGNIIKKGNVDSTIDPKNVLCIGPSQTLSSQNISSGWVKASSLDVAKIQQDGWNEYIEKLEAENADLRRRMAESRKLLEV